MASCDRPDQEAHRESCSSHSDISPAQQHVQPTHSHCGSTRGPHLPCAGGACVTDGGLPCKLLTAQVNPLQRHPCQLLQHVARGQGQSSWSNRTLFSSTGQKQRSRQTTNVVCLGIGQAQGRGKAGGLAAQCLPRQGQGRNKHTQTHALHHAAAACAPVAACCMQS